MAKVTSGKIAVVVRDHRAGIYFGYRRAADAGPVVVLDEARHIYYWTGRLSAADIAARGVGDGSKVAAEVAWVELRDPVAIFAASAEAIKSIAGAKPWER